LQESFVQDNIDQLLAVVRIVGFFEGNAFGL